MSGPLVVLAYSGGLDTSAIVPWLRERHGARVFCFAADVGQGAGELAGLVEKARRSGAVDCVVEDVREEFVRDFVWPALRAGAVYARTYLLGTAMARPVIAAHQAALARRVGATALAHGCTGKGNDQVRFDVAVAALDPRLKVIAPMRVGMGMTRDEELAYARQRGIDVPAGRRSPFSIDANLWGRSIEAGVLEDPWASAPLEAFAALPLFTMRSDLLNLGVQIFLAVVLAQSWNLLGGYAGQINLGHAAFFGLGALVTRTLWVGGTPLVFGLIAGALVATLYGIIIGIPAFRLNQHMTRTWQLRTPPGTRYLVVDTSNWVGGKPVLISAGTVAAVDSPNKIVRVELTRRQIEESPSVETADVELIETLPAVWIM